MGISNYFRRLFRRDETGAQTPSASPLNPSTDTIYQQSAYEAILKALEANPTGLNVATVYRCVQLLSDSVAQLPILYQKKRGGVYVTDEGSALDYLLRCEANPNMSAVEMIKIAVAESLLEGNAYIVPKYDMNSTRHSSLVLCSRGSVSHDTENNLYAVNDVDNNISGVYAEYEIIHIKGMPGRNPKRGVSVLTHARTAIDIAGSGDAETLKRFRNGGNVRGILKNAMTGRGLDAYDADQMQELADQMQERLNSSSAITVTPSDTDFLQLSMTSSDMQFLESRKFAVRDICRFFGVHPSFVFDDTSNNYKSAEMANVAFLSNTLNPMLRRIEAELQRKLIGPQGYGKQRIIFDRSGIYALDLDSKVKYYTQMLGAGAMTVNDVRALENMPSVEGGDRVLVSANLKGMTEMGAEAPENNTQE